MKSALIFRSSLLAALLTTLSPPLVRAAEFKCNGDAVERSGSTIYRVRSSGNDIAIEKSGSTKGRAVFRQDKYYVEVSGSTKAIIERGTIYRSGSRWATESDAKAIFDCGTPIAQTLWVLRMTNDL